MKQLFESLTQRDLIVGAVILVVALALIIFIIRKATKARLLKRLNQLEVSINSLRSTPLQYKLNKAVGLTKVNGNVQDQVLEVQEKFVEVTNSYDQITYLLGNIEDNIMIGKHRDGKEGLIKLENVYNQTKTQVNDLGNVLDRLLEDETRLRDNIIDLKNNYRDYKIDYQQKINLFGDTSSKLEEIMNDIEQQFNSFEEWMFASEYEKAQEESNRIKESIGIYATAVNVVPKLLEKAKGVVPHWVDEVSKAYQEVNQKGVFLQHLEVAKNLKIISDGLKEDLVNIREVQLEGVEDRLDTSIKRLQQLNTAINREDKAFDSVVALSATTFTQLDQVSDGLVTIESQFEELKMRFGFDALMEDVTSMKERVTVLKQDKEKIARKLSEEQIPSTSLQSDLSEFAQRINLIESQIQVSNQKISSARSDEQRAIKQLLKLHLIMNDISTKIESRHLPHIAETYNSDVDKAKSMINEISQVMTVNPLDIDQLNSTVNTSIDYIYRLYNNVNNLVGTVDMVENAIVYANKYRSSYPELDSELTRAEVAFRNGEYTYALKTVIYAIEKIKPGSPYEQLIIDNSRSA